MTVQKIPRVLLIAFVVCAPFQGSAAAEPTRTRTHQGLCDDERKHCLLTVSDTVDVGDAEVALAELDAALDACSSLGFRFGYDQVRAHIVLDSWGRTSSFSLSPERAMTGSGRACLQATFAALVLPHGDVAGDGKSQEAFIEVALPLWVLESSAGMPRQTHRSGCRPLAKLLDVFDNADPRFQLCFPGRRIPFVEAAIIIQPDGTVSEVTTDAKTPDVDRCFKSVLHDLTFSACPGPPLRMRVPVSFSPTIVFPNP